MTPMPSTAESHPRILLAFSYYRNPVDPSQAIHALCARLRLAGIRIDCMPITLDPPGPPLLWPDLDARWQRGDPALLASYERLVRKLDGFDALVNLSGINLHPEFVRQLGVATIFSCFDDPESSEAFSRPVATAYDLCMVGNVAEVATYQSWGVRRALWWPLGYLADDHDPTLTAERILEGRRDVDITMLCERVTGWRRERLDRFCSALPQGIYRGRAWPGGWLPEAERIPLYQRTRIGPNFHNSTGPVNSRTFVLPANGVMQVCDNRSHLGQVFELGKEVVGVDSMDEAIDACRYYLAHDDERRRIAAAGWSRATRDYSELAIYRRLEAAITETIAQRTRPAPPDANKILLELRRYRCRKPLAVAGAAIVRMYTLLRSSLGAMLRNLGLRR
jgi:spore maturation protein CgeB